MPTPTNLPGQMILLTRDQIRDKRLRAYLLRNPSASIAPKSEPYNNASSFADSVMFLSSNSAVLAQNASLSSKTGQDLTDESVAEGAGGRLPAVGAAGAVICQASSGGTKIFAGDEIKRLDGIRFQCLATKLYQPGEQIPIGSFTTNGADTGPLTNTAANTILKWTTPRPGCFVEALVFAQADGSGLTGGADAESDPQLQLRLANRRANPPASGNDADYQARTFLTPGVAIGSVFTIPSVLGAGTVCVMFTLRQATTGASRIPNGTHLALVLAWLTGAFPATDVIFVASLVSQPIDVAYRTSWANTSATWADQTPWPIYNASKVAVKPGTTPTALAFTLTNIDGATIVAPLAGNTIAFYDAPNQIFRRKKILIATFAGGTDYAIVCDTTNAVSDTSYIPYSTGAGQPCGAWSDSLGSLVPSTVAYFNGLGPGEQVASFWDPGLRERRSPRSPQFSPSTVSNRILGPLLSLPQVQDLTLQEPTVPFSTTVGNPGVSSNLITLRAIAAYPL